MLVAYQPVRHLIIWASILAAASFVPVACTWLYEHDFIGNRRADAQELFKQAKTQSNHGRIFEALRLLDQAILLDDSDSRMFYWRGWERLRAGQKNGAVRDLQRSIKLNPKEGETYYRLAIIESGDGLCEQAHLHFQAALDRGASPFWVHWHRGRMWEEHGETNAALSDYDECIKAEPQHGFVHFNRALLLFERGDERALEDFAFVSKSTPANEGDLYQRALSRMRLKDWTGALSDLNMVVTTGKFRPWVYNKRGKVRAALGDAVGAERDYESAVGFKAVNFCDYNLRGQMKLEQGDRNGARADLERAVMLNKNDSWSRRLLESLRTGEQFTRDSVIY